MSPTIQIDYSNCLPPAMGESAINLQEMKTDAFLHTAANIQAKQLNNSLPFSSILYEPGSIKQMTSYYNAQKAAYTSIVICGMGGSITGFQALHGALNHLHHNEIASKNNLPKIYTIDNADPSLFTDLLDVIDLAETLFIIISQSGNTVETISQFHVAKELLQGRGLFLSEHMLLITGNTKGVLYTEAQKNAVDIFPIPSELSGRFSLLSPVGLLPALFAGISLTALIKGAIYMDKSIYEDNPLEHPAFIWAIILILGAQRNKNTLVCMPYSQGLSMINPWIIQLFTESLGKKKSIARETLRLGPTVIGAVGTTHEHSQLQLFLDGPLDKIITMIELKSMETAKNATPHKNSLLYENEIKKQDTLLKTGRQAVAAALTAQGQMNITFFLPQLDSFYLGQFLQLCMYTTVFIADYYSIDPFSEPAIEQMKRF